MAQGLTPNEKKIKYEKLLEQATVYPPISIFTDYGNEKRGIYRVDGNAVRTFLVSEVERKRKELKQQQGEQGENC